MTKDPLDIAPWQLTMFGKTWRDMPGADALMKRMNFALFRRGKLKEEDLDQTVNRGFLPVWMKREGGEAVA